MNTPNGYKEIEKQFGVPYLSDGSENQKWAADHTAIVPPPAGWQLYYQADADHKTGTPKHLVKVGGIRIHTDLAEVFAATLTAVWERAKIENGGGASDDAIRSWLHEKRMDQHQGGYNFRNKKVPTAGLSLHAYGIAIDWDAWNNPHGKPWNEHTGFPQWWYDLWAANGWSDGRHFHTPDPMHVQFATGA